MRAHTHTHSVRTYMRTQSRTKTATHAHKSPIHIMHVPGSGACICVCVCVCTAYVLSAVMAGSSHCTALLELSAVKRTATVTVSPADSPAGNAMHCGVPSTCMTHTQRERERERDCCNGRLSPYRLQPDTYTYILARTAGQVLGCAYLVYGSGCNL